MKLLKPSVPCPPDGILPELTNRERASIVLGNWMRRHLGTALLPTRNPSALGDVFEGLCGVASPWEPRYFPLRDKVFEGYDVSSDNIADLAHALEDTLRCVRQLVLYSPGPDAIRSRDQAETIYLARVV